MSILDEYTKDFNEWAEAMDKKRDALIALFPHEKFEGHSARASLTGSMMVKIPWKDEIISASVQALLDAGFKETWRTDVGHDGQMTIRFYQGDADVSLIVNPDLPQSTCHKVKVGEETKTEDIYEVVCND